MWIENLPGWVQVQAGDATQFPSLDAGEAAALALAIASEALRLVDDADARRVAQSVGITTIGTVGVLVEAHIAALLDFDTAVAALKGTTFHVHDAVIAAARQAIREDFRPDNPAR